jgi:hypothetical protein
VRVDISVLEKPFVNAGYVAKGNIFSNLKIVCKSIIGILFDADAPKFYLELELKKTF